MKKLTISMAAALVALSLTGSTVLAEGASLTQLLAKVGGQPGAPAAQAAQTAQAPQRDSQLVISEAGTYVLTGSMRGSVLVDPGAGDVHLILDNVAITNPGGGCIAAVSGDHLTLSLAENSVNTLADGSQPTGYGAAIYSQVGMTLEGSGQLHITAQGNGIETNGAPVVFTGGDYHISAMGQALAGGSEAFSILGGSVNALSRMGMSAQTQPVQAAQLAYQPTQSTQAEQPVNQPTQAEQSGTQSGQNQQMVNQPTQSGQNQQAVNQPTQPAQNQQTVNQPTQPGQNQQMINQPTQPTQGQQSGNQPGMLPGTQGQDNWGSYDLSDSPTSIVTSDVVNTAALLEADYDNATTITLSDSDSQVKITSSGTYIVTGASSDGNITVKKGTTGVVLVLEDLDLTSTTGATISVNKQAEVKIIVSGNVTLTDSENPADENSADADVADAFDGAAIKVKADGQVFITGDGTLNINGNAKNGIKGGDNSSIVIDGDLTMNITAANDGINANYDLTVLSGHVNISAGDDAMHADHILTIGREDGTGPDVHITASYEGLEGTVVNLFGGNVSVVSSDDAVNAANGDGAYEGVLDYAINITGGTLTIRSQGDGLDSNGHINILGGDISIQSASMGGEAGIDYDGQLYVADAVTLNNQSGIAGPDNMMMGQQPGMGQQMGQQMPGMGDQSAQQQMPGRSQQPPQLASNQQTLLTNAAE